MKMMGGIVMIVGILSVVPAMAGDYGGGFDQYLVGRARHLFFLRECDGEFGERFYRIGDRRWRLAVTKVRSARSPA